MAMQLSSRICLSGVLFFATTSVAVPLPAQELAPDEAQAIARDAYIYGFPIVENYKAMHAFAIDTDGEDYQAPCWSVWLSNRVTGDP